MPKNKNLLLKASSKLALRSHDLASLPTTSRLIGVLSLLDLPDHELEGFGYILIVTSACLRAGAFEFFGHLLAVFDRNLALLWPQVTFVSNNDYWNPF